MVGGVKVVLSSYLHIGHHVDLGVIAKHSSFLLLHVLPPLLLFDVDRHEDFVDSVE